MWSSAQKMAFRAEVLVHGLLTAVAAFLLSLNGARPLIDYDEATYAKVVVDTLQQGHGVSLLLHGAPWFEKPPLMFWLTMRSVEVWGRTEWAFRVPSMCMALVCLSLTYLIARRLSGKVDVAILAYVLLLCTPPFYYFAKEFRLDMGVLAAILASVYLWLRGIADDRYLAGVGPVLALGVLCKSVIAGLAIPAMVLYSAVYGRWAWVKNRYLWAGAVAGGVLVAPWHVWETVQYGGIFWHEYVWRHVFERATTTLVGTRTAWDYIGYLWVSCPIWVLAVFICVILGVMSARVGGERRLERGLALVNAGIAGCVFLIFTVARTHLPPYVLPAYPFLAIGLSMGWLEAGRVSRWARYALAGALVGVLGAGLAYGLASIRLETPAYVLEEKYIGELYLAHARGSAPLYGLDWDILETINYYGRAHTRYRASADSSVFSQGNPSYVVTRASEFRDLEARGNTLLARRLDASCVLYRGMTLVFLYVTDQECPDSAIP
jgi:4-amino-4-deoxy-L-arabinose transferase-like glycosyltransferase